MTKVHLRKYTSEIDELIEAGQTDEAIAHCQHILKTFPKHLETYRLLGKAYLEARRYDEATDIFRRVLHAVPDDFIAHVGLSIIADEQNRLEDAIWHMERAFEKQPSNAAIQAELQRLYGRRDGREPPRIHLTRGALAHMYYQGELYPQAINEIKAVLTEDPERLDMLSLLALTYFRSGQKVEASEICARLLARSPYHLDANRILAEILPGTAMAEKADEYRRRVIELDPYAAYASSVFRTDEVPSPSVTLERLEYTPPSAETVAWETLSPLAGETQRTEPPDWLKTSLAAESTPPVIPSPSEQTIQTPPEPAAPSLDLSQPPAEDVIPDWMRAAGWEPASGTFDEAAFSAADLGEPATEGELAQAELPDWLKAMAPSEAETSAEPLAPAELPDWIQAMAPSEPEPPPVRRATQGDVPDWLKDIMEPDLATEEPSAPGEQPATRLVFEELSAPEAPPPTGYTQEPAAEELPAWLRDLEQKALAAEESLTSWPSAEEPPAPTMGMATPPAPGEPRLAEAVTPSPSASQPYPDLSHLGTTPEDQDAALRWLESLAARQGAQPEELITDPNARLERPPEWVEQFLTGATTPASTQPPEPQPFAQPPRATSPIPEEPPAGAPQAAAEELPAWPRDLEQETPPAVAQPAFGEPATPEAPPPTGYTQEPAAEELPPWLADFHPTSEEPVDATSLVASESIWTPSSEEISAYTQEETISSVETSRGETRFEASTPPGEATPEVPEAHDIVAGLPEAPMAEATRSDIPEWLKALEEEETSAVAKTSAPAETSYEWSGEIELIPKAGSPGQSPADADIPAWLREIEEPKPEAAPSGLMDEIGDLPEWLRSEEPETPPPPPPPTRPSDWAPEIPVPPAQPASREQVQKPSSPKAGPRPEAKPETALPTEAVDRARPRRTGILPPLIDPALAAAREAMQRGKIPDALQAYSKLIRKGKFLDDIIFDLKDALYRFPVEVSIWQTLGDAYMRANRLQDALDAYTKAEELLR